MGENKSEPSLTEFCEAIAKSYEHRINILCSEAENARIGYRPITKEMLDARIDILKDQLEVWKGLHLR